MRLLRVKAPAKCVLAFLAAAALAGLVSCATLPKSQQSLPARHIVRHEQLVVYSNFTLPTHHRLLEDVKLLRGDVLGRLNLTPSDEPVHVYLFEGESQYSTFLRQYYPGFPSRRAFFVKSDTRLAVYAQWGDRVAEDLRHEVTHGYLHSVLPYVPLWLDEGLAEYFEVPRGQGGLNRPHIDLLLAKLLEHGWRPNMERLEQLSTTGEMTQDDYAEAWAWVHWMLESHPQRAQLLQAHLAGLKVNPVYQPLSLQLRSAEPEAHHALLQHLYGIASALGR